MTTTSSIWSPEQLKRINDDPALVNLLYDLNLLPEVVLAHIRHAREEERERCAKIADALGAQAGNDSSGAMAHMIAQQIRASTEVKGPKE